MLFSPCVDGFQSGSPLSSCRWIEPGAVKQKHCSDICQNYLISFSEYPENLTDETLIQCKICEFTQFYYVIKMVYTQSVNTAYHYRWQQFFLSQYCLFNACLLSVLLLFYMSAGTPYHRWTVSFPLHTHKNCGLYHCKKKKKNADIENPPCFNFFYYIFLFALPSHLVLSVSLDGAMCRLLSFVCLTRRQSLLSPSERHRSVQEWRQDTEQSKQITFLVWQTWCQHICHSVFWNIRGRILILAVCHGKCLDVQVNYYKKQT